MKILFLMKITEKSCLFSGIGASMRKHSYFHKASYSKLYVTCSGGISSKRAIISKEPGSSGWTSEWDLEKGNLGQSRLINSCSLLSATEVISSGEDWAEGQAQDRHQCCYSVKGFGQSKSKTWKRISTNTWRLYCSPPQLGS